MTQNSPLFERIMELIRYYKIKNVSELARVYLKYDSPEKINRLKVDGRYPSFEIILDIANTFEKIDINWFVTGRGKMLKEGDSNDKNTAFDQIEKYIAVSFDEIKFLRGHVGNLQRENSDLVQIVKSHVISKNG